MQQIPKELKSKEWLYNQYITERKTQSSIGELLGVSTGVVHYWIKKNGLVGSRTKIKNKVNEDLFNIENPVFCYLCGLCAADGYCDLKWDRISIRLNPDDSLILHKLRSYFSLSTPIRFYRGKQMDLSIASKKMLNIMKELGIAVPKKTFNLRFPILPNELSYKMFIRGYLDGDGNIRPTGFRALTGSVEFFKGLIDFIDNKFDYKINLTFQKGKKEGVYYPKIESNSYKAIKILEWVYSDYEDFSLERKYNSVKAILNK